MPTITAEHLRQHGFTVTRYRRAYGALTRAPRDSTAGSPRSADDPRADQRAVLRHNITSLAREIVSDPDVIRELAGEVSEAIFSTSLRDKLRLSLIALITKRLHAHGEACAALDNVRAALGERWRTTQGGPNGAPTPTKDLVAMASVLGGEVKSGEELLLKTVKLAIEEWRSHKGQAVLEGGLDRYSGSAERLPVPDTLTAQDRETIRTLWGMFDRAVDRRRALTVDVTPTAGSLPGEVAVQDTAEHGGAEVQAVEPTPAGSSESEECSLISRVEPDEPF